MTAVRTSSAQRRRPVEGGYACGEETRAQIVAAALKVFSEEGFAQASTRRIAERAGVNPPALQYYFGGKEGLHRACAQLIIDRAKLILETPMARAEEAVQQDDRRLASAALETLFDTLLSGLLEERADGWRRFVARTRIDDAGPARGMIIKEVSLPLIDSVARLIGIVMRRPAEEPVLRLRACSLLAMVGSLCTHGDLTMAVMRWPSLTAERLELIKGVVREHVRALSSSR